MSDYPSIKLADVHKGQRFYECESGKNAELIALEDARPVDEPQRQGFVCKVRHGNEELELFEAHNSGGYGLRLYRFPMYG